MLAEEELRRMVALRAKSEQELLRAQAVRVLPRIEQVHVKQLRIEVINDNESRPGALGVDCLYIERTYPLSTITIFPL